MTDAHPNMPPSWALQCNRWLAAAGTGSVVLMRANANMLK